MKLSGENLNEVSFPVGGIGAGCIGISGRGRLSDWEIFNHAGKGLGNGISHFAVRAECSGRTLAARILNGDLVHDLCGVNSDPDALFRGFGWGPEEGSLASLPHFRECELDGAFPAAEYRFGDPGFPGPVRLSAWSPFVPGRSYLASLPVAIFEITVTNPGTETIDFTCVGVLSHFHGGTACADSVQSADGITTLVLGNHLEPDDFDFGELALSTDAREVSFQEYLCRGAWRDHLEVYWHDLNQPGKFRNRHFSSRAENDRRDSGLLAVHLRTLPGESRTARFIISWYFPNRRNDWDNPEQLAEQMRRSGVPENRWRNFYARLCSGAADAARKIFVDYSETRREVFTFRTALHESTLPEPALEGAAENLAVLISPTCLRLEDGTFWGWEGVGPRRGSCPGSCQHVWNYAQALPLLFPDLERLMREAHAKYSLDERGGMHFRMALPPGVRAFADGFRPAVDGSFGEIMKTFREWRICGDTGWLQKMWPTVRKILEFTWSRENPDRWDPDATGVLSGRQHHTLDMELFGPSGWLQGHYLGALSAAARMARACDEPEFAAKCEALFERGRKYAAAELFNTDHFIQKLDLTDRNIFLPYLAPGEKPEDFPYWDAEHGEIKYQIGEGYEIDSHLGAWYAKLYGIGEIFAPEQLRAELLSLHRHNYLPSLREYPNTWRCFALNDEAATVICTWPEASKRPVIPLPYHSEAMTGFEWALAAHLVMAGLTIEGERTAAAIRARYDGRKRNPWNEIECGSNYARSLAAYAMLQAYSGFSYDMTRRFIGFSPVAAGDFRCFWSLGVIWGVYRRDSGGETIEILHGKAEFACFGIQGEHLYRNGTAVPAIRTENGVEPLEPLNVTAGDELHFE